MLGVIIWIVLAVWVEIIAGFAGALMGIMFILVYKKINPTDKSIFPIIIASVLIVVEILSAEMLSVVLLSSIHKISLDQLFNNSDFVEAIIIDVSVGLLFSIGAFVAYVLSSNKKEKLNRAKIATDNSEAAIIPEEQPENKE